MGAQVPDRVKATSLFHQLVIIPEVALLEAIARRTWPGSTLRGTQAGPKEFNLRTETASSLALSEAQATAAMGLALGTNKST